jgi:putative hemolysin
MIIIAGLIVLNGVFAYVGAGDRSCQNVAFAGQRRRSVGAKPRYSWLRSWQVPFNRVPGITLMIITGAYSGASLEGPVGERLAMLGVPDEHSRQVGFVAVIAVTTYLSMVGELVPSSTGSGARRSRD